MGWVFLEQILFWGQVLFWVCKNSFCHGTSSLDDLKAVTTGLYLPVLKYEINGLSPPEARATKIRILAVTITVCLDDPEAKMSLPLSRTQSFPTMGNGK